MGGLLIKNKELRCKDCFKLYSLKIEPDFPMSKIRKTCNCSTTNVEIENFLYQYKNNNNFSVFCSKCKKINPKEPNYCYECKKLYCINCNNLIHNEKNKNKNHKLITIDKYDFFCICHQNEYFCAYCKTCKMNICQNCIKEKLHENHNILIYNKMYNDKKMREYLKQATKLAELKLEYNTKICSKIRKEIKKKELIKNLDIINEISEDENKKILEMINILYEIYDISKTRNYTIIMNVINNINFNFERIIFKKKTSKEKDAEALIKYLKTDFILMSKHKKEIPQSLEDQFFNDKFNNFDKEKKEENDIKQEKNNKIINEEDKKEENEEDKKEDKKEEIIINEIEENDIRRKSIKERRKIIERKINEKGGFQQVVSGPNNNKNNDIIAAPKGSPDDVINIINNQTVIKKVKKKPKKINFQSD